MITPKQIGSAMGGLGWSDSFTAKKLEVSLPTFKDIRTGKNKKVNYLSKLQTMFEIEGLEFIEHNGVRERPTSSVQTLEGQEGFWQFYDDVHKTAKERGGELLVSNVDESEFDKWIAERDETQKNQMIDLYDDKKFTMKVLIKEGDYNFTVPEFAKYRWTPKERFSEIPFYVYGTKLAIILFEENNVSIFIIDNAKISNAYKKQFNVMWDQAIIIPESK